MKRIFTIALVVATANAQETLKKVYNESIDPMELINNSK